MKIKSTPKNVKIENLVLDKDNPRFAELYSGSEKEEDLINYLLYNESAEEVAKSIFRANEFYPDRPLWVIKNGDGYLVKDGNRRCASVKALQHPLKYGLGESLKMKIVELPVLEYKDVSDVNERIRQEHTSNLFKQWGRIAKALEVYRLFTSGTSIEAMTDYDSQPKELIKLASFYYEAVKISGEDFKMLLRSGRGKTGGKTIIFERLFKYRKDCGYNFKNKSTNEIIIKHKELFTSYIKAMVAYLKDNPNTKTKDIDNDKESFLLKLKPYGFPPEKEYKKTGETKSDDSGKSKQEDPSSLTVKDSSSTTTGSTPAGTGTPAQSSQNPSNNNESPSIPASPKAPQKRKSIKHRPTYARKQIPAPLENLVNECYNLDQNNFANSKTAMSRVTFECTLKYIVENTNKANGKALSTSNHFNSAFYNKQLVKLTYTNFDVLKNKFTELILDTGIRKAFENFDLQVPHQIIHNYRVRAVPDNAKALCDNLIDLIEFMLQEDADLLSSLDISKL